MSRACAFLLAWFCAFLLLPGLGWAADSSKGPTSGVVATVITDGALILIEPDPDSTPIAQLPEGKKIRVSKSTTSGENRFRKTRVGKRIGFIADIDVRVGEAPISAKDKLKDKLKDTPKKKKSDRKAAAKRRMSDPGTPIYFSRFVGVIVGGSEFKEEISGVDASASMPFYGLKITGPDVLIDGPIIDFNLLLHYGAPAYYESLSSIKPTGFVLLSDAAFLLPVWAGQNGMVYLGAGPMIMLSQFTVFNGGRKQDLTEINLGLDVDLGVAYRIDQVALRLEGK